VNYNFKTKELTWTHLIHKEVEEYKRFINNSNLPNFKIIFSHNTKENPDYVMRVEAYKRPIILYVNSGYMIDRSFDYKSTLYHEFTHLWDYGNLLKNMPSDEKSKRLSLLTEFHASYVESLFIMGAKTINDIQILEMDKITGMINNDILLIKETGEKFTQTKAPKDYDHLLSSYMYYFGRIVAHNISGNIITPDSFDNSFDETLHLYFKALELNSINDEIIELSGKVKTLLDKIFIEIAITEAGE